MAYIVLASKTRPMPTAGNSAKLVAEIKLAWENPKEPPIALFSKLQPWFEHWSKMLKEPSYKKDINYITMCRRIEFQRNAPGNEIISEWVKHIEIDMERNLINELQFIFLEFLRLLKYFPTFASNLMTEYVVARGFKERLQARIALLHRVETVRFNADVLEAVLYSTPEYKDHLLLKNMHLSSWENYLMQLMQEDLNSYQIAEISRIPRKTFEPEENNLWNRLKELYHAELTLQTKKQ